MLEHATSETDLDRIVRMFDGANLIVRGFDGVIQRWISGCEQLYGWSAAEALGKVVHDLLDTQFPAEVEELRGDRGYGTMMAAPLMRPARRSSSASFACSRA